MNRAIACLLLLASPRFMNTKTIQAGRHFLRSTRVLVMARQVVILILGELLAFHAVGAAELELTSPRDFQVVQRATPTKGAIRIAGQLSENAPGDAVVETRFVGAKPEAKWQKLDAQVSGRAISGLLEAPVGGWWRLEVRVSNAGKVVASRAVEHVGVGEVFVVAGQSNSANHGEEIQLTQTKRVAAFDGKQWRLADDPQPGASGNGGSFIPPFADGRHPATRSRSSSPVRRKRCASLLTASGW